MAIRKGSVGTWPRGKQLLIIGLCTVAIVLEVAVISHYSSMFKLDLFEYSSQRSSRPKKSDYVIIEERPQDRTRKADQVSIGSGISNPVEHAFDGKADVPDP